MDSQLGAPILESLPDRVRTELTDVDRLRAIWARHRQCQTLEARAAARRSLTHDRVQRWGGGPALADLLLVDPVEPHPPMTADHIAGLAGRVAEQAAASGTPESPLSAEQTRALAEAAIVPAHPVVRAAHVYAECARRLNELNGPPPGAPEGAPTRILPWVLASRVLQRADHPPLLPDPRTPAPPARVGPGEGGHFAELVTHFARLVTEALRAEIGWGPRLDPVIDAPVPPLSAVTRRRVLDYVRSRGAPVELILRALDPKARATVTSGDGTSGAGCGVAPRALLTPGATHWWTRLELEVGEVRLSLYVVVQDVGRPPSGVLAVTANARLTTPEGVQDVLEMSGSDSVTVMPSDCVDDRWPQVRDLVDEAVSRSMNALTRA
ncbi:MAG TPA: hypothetical protein K8V84_05670 [Nocardiopsis listeri]|uniref:hypothetical protein n=1 Tax=Nocardiopsis listeri TaxID=53440 RepID=UPI001D680556|nr:hypothetical protein [Nocardiopsis listeri]HJE57991.1 hypothetical protein [Nocardiopsis listeri]